MNIPTEPYQKRPIRFLDLWRHGDWGQFGRNQVDSFVRRAVEEDEWDFTLCHSK
ncbi:MAG: hypothetical protein ACI8UO_006245 [Verrucomicrobiales bacterium]|jgi:hypothetical protein